MVVILHAPDAANPSLWPPLAGECVDVVLDLQSFLADLKCERLYHQLEMDVPRCRVTVGGAPTRDPRVVFCSTPHPILCTQAVMAPFVEWAVYSGYLLTEPTPKYEMCIFVDRHFVHVQKTLEKRKDFTVQSVVELQVLADVKEGRVVLRWKEDLLTQGENPEFRSELPAKPCPNDSHPDDTKPLLLSVEWDHP